MALIFGSARSDERGKASGGKAGDQTGREVSTQADYDHPKGWYLYRAKDGAKANKMALEMSYACSNNHIGYDQGERVTLMTYIKTNKCKSMKDVKSNVETDCAQLIRAVVYIVYGVDLNSYASQGNFYTGNACEAMAKSGLFTKVNYVSKDKTKQYNGDIKCTKVKGHIGMIVSGRPRTDVSATATSTTVTTGGKKDMVSVEFMTLCKGCVCDDVRLAKLLLNHHGAKLDVKNSNFLDKTTEAVKKFQKDNKLDADGVIGVQTWKKLLEVS